MPTPFPYPHQVAGALYLADAPRQHKLLGDEPGLGKTRQVIDAVDRLGLSRVLVLCPAIGKLVWRDEIPRWSSRNHAVTIADRRTTHLPDAGYVVCNYDMLSRGEAPLLKALYARRWDALVLDEADLLRNIDAKRTQLVFGENADLIQCLGARAIRIWALTGTPAPKHAGELWPILRALAPDLITDPRKPRPMNLAEFQERYCRWRETPTGRQITGSRNMLTLQPKLRSFMLRRRKRDVLKDLPPLRFAVLPVSVDMAEITPEMWAEFDTLDQDIREIVAGLTGQDFLTACEHHPHYSTHRRLLGQIKASIAVKLLDQELQGNERKLIVFAHHTAVLDTLERELSALGHKPVLITGSTPTRLRTRAVNDFQSKPEVRVFLGQTLAAGTTITLTASSDVVFVEPSTVPRDNVQAASRPHRIGQKNPVLARLMALDGTMDDRIIRLIERRTEEIAALLDDDKRNLGAPEKRK